MHNNITSKHHCIICGKSGSIYICDGCHLTFCSRHVLKHREELSYQLENLIQDYNLLRYDIEQSSNEYHYLRKIDKWEKESIKKIRITAENARIDLKQIVNKSKQELIKISRDINFDLNSSRKTDDFSENDLKKWMKQLNDLRSEIQSLAPIELIEDQHSPIYRIKIINNKNRNIRKNHLNNSNNNSLNSDSQEYFFKATNCASIENQGLIVKHIGPDLEYAHILGKQYYSQGRHTNRFKILQCTLPYIIFFGCISSKVNEKIINYNSPFVVGWFGYHEIYQHGIWNNNLTLHEYDSNEFETNDILQLTFDCDYKQIELFHERTSKTHKLPVNIDKAPFPWQILIVLVHQDDSVKILPKR